ncbi:MazG-like nucleotide pyrophosphohydrolase [Arthrobacter phage Zucker]|nr:MazG-like nucleotide pyrophosphohydrolase [Arthrobacter phage Zucker]
MTIDNTAIARGLAELVHASGTNSREHGFHDDWPVDVDLINPGRDRDYQKAIVEKLALIHEEVSEMLGEIRSGRDPLDIYFVDTKGAIGEQGREYSEQQYSDGGEPLLKPEGFLVEGADAIIRLADLTFLVDGSDKLIEAREIKHEYNATRPYKHGRKF